MAQLSSKITISQLKNFVLVVEEKGFHAAAKKMSRSQPAISKSIKKLEGTLGGALFEKGNNATVTPLGAYFYPQAKEVVVKYDKVITDVQLYSMKQSGQITIAVLPSVANAILPNIIKEYLSRYSKIQVNVQDENSERIHRRVLEGAVDFGISHLWEDHPDLAFHELLRDPIGLLCSVDHALATADVVTWDMLTAHNFINNGTTRLLQNTQAEKLVEQAQLSIENMVSLLAVLEANIGITTLPHLAFPKGNTQLCFREISSPTVERTIGLITRRGFSGSPAVQAMKEIVLEQVHASNID